MFEIADTTKYEINNNGMISFYNYEQWTRPKAARISLMGKLRNVVE
jgi:hypothetical protein